MAKGGMTQQEARQIRAAHESLKLSETPIDQLQAMFTDLKDEVREDPCTSAVHELSAVREELSRRGQLANAIFSPKK